MQNLGTFFGPSGFGAAHWINNNDEVVGRASNSDNTGLVAFLWKDKVLRNLGTLGGFTCSSADSINSRGQIVGNASDCSEESLGLFWDHGGPPVDLNTLIVPGNDHVYHRGLADRRSRRHWLPWLGPGDTEAHACLLIPCDENHRGVEGCDYSLVETSAASEIHPAPTSLTQSSFSSAAGVSPSPSATAPFSRVANHQRRFGNLPPK